MNASKMFNKRKTAIALLAVVFLLSWIPNILADDDDSIDPEKNIIAIHNSKSDQYDKDCTECHADILSAQSLEPAIPNVHVAMIPFTPGEKDEKTCVVCHRTVDLLQGSAGNIRKQVKAKLCAMCHGPAGPATQFYQAEIALDGPELYDLACASCHRDLANSEVSGESADEIQEEIDEDEGGMGPLRALSTERIQAIAAALAQ
jgi:hypothetical protein